MTARRIQPRGAATTARVIDATFACFVRGGLDRTSIQHIAKASRTSVGSIYHHFGSRERVLFALYTRCLEHMLESIARAVTKETDAERGVRALVTSYLAFVQRHPDEARFIYAAAHTPIVDELRAEIVALAQRVTAPVVAWVYRQVAAGALVNMPPHLYETVLIGPAAEASRRILSGARDLTFAQAKRALPDIAWRAVRSS